MPSSSERPPIRMYFQATLPISVTKHRGAMIASPLPTSILSACPASPPWAIATAALASRTIIDTPLVFDVGKRIKGCQNAIGALFPSPLLPMQRSHQSSASCTSSSVHRNWRKSADASALGTPRLPLFPARSFPLRPPLKRAEYHHCAARGVTETICIERGKDSCRSAGCLGQHLLHGDDRLLGNRAMVARRVFLQLIVKRRRKIPWVAPEAQASLVLSSGAIIAGIIPTFTCIYKRPDVQSPSPTIVLPIVRTGSPWRSPWPAVSSEPLRGGSDAGGVKINASRAARRRA